MKSDSTLDATDIRILGDLDCIGSLNSSFVLGEVKNTHELPLPDEDKTHS